MKKINIAFSISLLFLLGLFGCQEHEFKEVEEPVNKAELIAGNWKLAQVIQYDVNAVNKGFPTHASQKDITTVFPQNPYTDFAINLQSSGSFTTTKGNSLMTWPEQGTWRFDSTTAPAYIFLESGSTSIKIELGALNQLNSASPKLNFKITRYDKGKAVLYYNYSFAK